MIIHRFDVLTSNTVLQVRDETAGTCKDIFLLFFHNSCKSDIQKCLGIGENLSSFLSIPLTNS